MLVNITSERRPIHIERGGTTCRRLRAVPKWILWKRSRAVSLFFQCLDTEGEIVATYRATAMTISKDGELTRYGIPRIFSCPFTRRNGSWVNP